MLCSLLQETLPHTIPPKAVEDALAKSIFAYVKKSPGFMWIPENGK